MKNIILALSIIFMMTSCSQKKVILNYDSTNPVRIEKANQGLDLASILPSPDEVNGTIAIRSIEGAANGDLDDGVVYSIEDNLVANLLQAGYRVVERDPDALDNLYKEESTKYSKHKSKNSRQALFHSLDLSVLTPDSYLLVDGEKSGDVSASGCCDSNAEVFDYLVTDHKSIVAEKDRLYAEDMLVSTGLSASDYILSYRVLECGVNYFELDNLNKFATKISQDSKYERSARTRLHCRLTDSKTSEILAAGLVENEVTDIVNKDDVKALQQMSYKYYHHTLPNNKDIDDAYRESSGYAKSNEDVTAEKNSNSSQKKGVISKIKDKISGLFKKK